MESRYKVCPIVTVQKTLRSSLRSMILNQSYGNSASGALVGDLECSCAQSKRFAAYSVFYG
jgi:hypothetical protein